MKKRKISSHFDTKLSDWKKYQKKSKMSFSSDSSNQNKKELSEASEVQEQLNQDDIKEDNIQILSAKESPQIKKIKQTTTTNTTVKLGQSGPFMLISTQIKAPDKKDIVNGNSNGNHFSDTKEYQKKEEKTQVKNQNTANLNGHNNTEGNNTQVDKKNNYQKQKDNHNISLSDSDTENQSTTNTLKPDTGDGSKTTEEVQHEQSETLDIIDTSNNQNSQPISHKKPSSIDSNDEYENPIIEDILEIANDIAGELNNTTKNKATETKNDTEVTDTNNTQSPSSQTNPNQDITLEGKENTSSELGSETTNHISTDTIISTPDNSSEEIINVTADATPQNVAENITENIEDKRTLSTTKSISEETENIDIKVQQNGRDTLKPLSSNQKDYPFLITPEEEKKFYEIINKKQEKSYSDPKAMEQSIEDFTNRVMKEVDDLKGKSGI